MACGVARAASARRSLSGAGELMKRQPATSATSLVASFDPASATMTSLTSPLTAPGTSADRVGTKRRSNSWVAMIAVSMERGIRLCVAPYHGVAHMRTPRLMPG